VDTDPPAGFCQCAGFINTAVDDVGPQWENDCLTSAWTLRLRYWDTTTVPWTLLGDGTLSPANDPDTSQWQIYDAVSNGGALGVMESQGVELLKDCGLAYFCNYPGLQNDFWITDIWLGTFPNNQSLAVCSEHSTCDHFEEMMLLSSGYLFCSQRPHFNSLAIAIYRQ
jgi:hypothetical protein